MSIDAQESPSGERDSVGAVSARRLTWLLSAEVILIAILRLPYDLGFTAFAFADRGSWLTATALAAEGHRPAVDFGYPYGLLPMLLGAGWFRLWGLTPRAYQAANVLFGLAIAWAIARFVRVLRLPFVAVALVIVALPFAIQSSYPSLAHALEAVLLSIAIAEHASGRRRNALALAAAACFAKPSMGYVYGLVILCGVAADLRRRGLWRGITVDWRALWREVAPTASVVLILVAILGGRYGPRSLFATLIPLAGMKNYAAMGFGFFRGSGRYFWYGTPVHAYFGSVIAFWFGASLVLVAGGLRALVRLWRGAGELESIRHEIILSTAILHVAFVTKFFAGPASWGYYSYILVSGAAACCTVGRISTLGGWILVALAASGQTSTRVQDVINWQSRTPRAVTAGLWASAEQRSAWQAVLRTAGDQRAVIILGQGCAPMLFPELERNSYAYLTPGVVLPQELDQALQQFAAAPIAIAIRDPDYGYALTLIPQVVAVLKRRQPIFRNEFFAVYRRAPG